MNVRAAFAERRDALAGRARDLAQPASRKGRPLSIRPTRSNWRFAWRDRLALGLARHDLGDHL